MWSRRQKAKVHLTTECSSKVNHSENFCPQPPCLAVGCQPFDFSFFESRNIFFFGSRPKAFLNAFPQPPSLIKDMAGFSRPLRLLLLLSFSQSPGPCLGAESTFQMQTPLPLSLLLFCRLPCAFSFPTGWPVVRAA